MEINKLYLKLGSYTPDELPYTILGYFKQFTAQAESGKVFKVGCNFDESTDFATAIKVDNVDYNEIEIGHSKYINGEFIK